VSHPAENFGKPHDSESADQCFVVDVVEEPLDIKLQGAAAASLCVGCSDVVCECEACASGLSRSVGGRRAAELAGGDSGGKSLGTG
jgi:hypothetical protein